MPASYVRQCVRRWPSLLNQKKEKMVHAVPPVMTSTSLNVSIVVSARSLARWIRLSRHRSSSFTFEGRGENVITKQQLLAVGDRFEKQIAADREADAAYR